MYEVQNPLEIQDILARFKTENVHEVQNPSEVLDCVLGQSTMKTEETIEYVSEYNEDTEIKVEDKNPKKVSIAEVQKALQTLRDFVESQGSSSDSLKELFELMCLQLRVDANIELAK